MVKKVNISAYEGEPPTNPDLVDSRKIAGGPLYDRNTVIDFCDKRKCVVVTDGCNRALQDLAMDLAEACDLIKVALQVNKRKSSEWCQTNIPKSSNGDEYWAACDVYLVKYTSINSSTGYESENDYYIKFSVGKNGLFFQLVRLHV